MFSKVFRLPFSRHFQNARVFHSHLFTLKVVSNNLTHNRYGFIASKVIDKRAVYRNAVKRKFRAIVELSHSSLAQGYDLLFILKKTLTNTPLEEQKKEFSGKIKLL